MVTMFGPLTLDPENGDATLCTKCGKAVMFIVRDEPIGGGEYERVDAWWAHFVHPTDEHDAEVDRGKEG